MKHTLTSETFSLELELQIFEADIAYSSNTIMTVTVESDGFRGCTDMDIDIKDFARFAAGASRLYDTLGGTARIEEPYGHQQFLELAGDGIGHVEVCGMLHSGTQELRFENVFDQTYLKDFAKEIERVYGKYRT